MCREWLPRCSAEWELTAVDIGRLSRGCRQWLEWYAFLGRPICTYAFCSVFIRLVTAPWISVRSVWCAQEALSDLCTFADGWKHFVGYVQIMLPYQLLRSVRFSTRSLCRCCNNNLHFFICYKVVTLVAVEVNCCCFVNVNLFNPDTLRLHVALRFAATVAVVV